MAPGPLEDRCPFRVERGPVPTSSSSDVEVGDRVGEAVERGPGPGPGQPGGTVVGGIAHHYLGQLRGGLVVRDTAEELPVEQEQVDQEALRPPPVVPRSLPGSCRCSSAARRSIWACRFVERHPRWWCAGRWSRRQAGDDGRLLRWSGHRGEDGPQVRWVRVGGVQVGEAATRRLGRPVDAVADPRSVQAADQQRVENVHDVIVGGPAAGGGVRTPGEHGPLDLEEAAVGERLRGVDDEEVRQQQLGQRVDALLVRWPVAVLPSSRSKKGRFALSRARYAPR